MNFFMPILKFLQFWATSSVVQSVFMGSSVLSLSTKLVFHCTKKKLVSHGHVGPVPWVFPHLPLEFLQQSFVKTGLELVARDWMGPFLCVCMEKDKHLHFLGNYVYK